MEENTHFGAASELDMAVIHALEVNPRGTWDRLAATLGVGPVTVRRRWEALAASGSAWIAVVPTLSDFASAVVRVNCAAGRKREVAEMIAADRPAFTVEITGGAADLLVTVVTETAPQIPRYVLDRLDCVPGVTSTRTALVTEWFSEGTQWRIGALSRAQESAIAADVLRGAHRGGSALSEVDRALISCLSADGRLSYRELGGRTGVSASTAARRVERLLKGRALSLRCDVASGLSGRPFHAGLQLVVPPARLRAVGRQLARWPQVRMSAGVADEANLRVSVWLRRPSELIEFEERLSAEFADTVVRDRTLDLQVVKRVGHLLDERGGSRGVVPCAAY